MLLAFGCLLPGGCAGTPDAVVTFEHGPGAPASALPPLVNRSQGIALHSCADLIAALRAAKDLGEVAE